MKKHLLLFIISVCAMHAASAYTTVSVHDSITTNTTWTNTQQYLIKGFVYVTNGATLTIDAGTVIKGDHDTKGTLVVKRGAKIFANGTACDPVIFTSDEDPGNRNYGDWGGIIICGSAPTNWIGNNAQIDTIIHAYYGGNLPHDNSGSLSYVRIEFAGISLTPNHEANGLSLCGVGDLTIVDHVQISYSNNDGFGIFGGTVNAKYLVSYRTWDDDIEADNGFTGKAQYGVIVRDRNVGDMTGSKGFESTGYQAGTDTINMTKPVFSNFTAIGPLDTPTTTQFADEIQAGVQMRSGSAMSVLNSIIVGWPRGVMIEEALAQYTTTSGNIGTGELQFQHNIICGTSTQTAYPRDIFYAKDGIPFVLGNADTIGGIPVPHFTPYPGPWSWLLDTGSHNKIYPLQTDAQLTDPFNIYTNPNLLPVVTSPVCYNAVHPFDVNSPLNPDTTNNYANYNMPTVYPDFTVSKANDPFFDHVNYVGAFASAAIPTANWMDCWVEWHPDTVAYNKVHPASVNNVANTGIESANVYPNPASGNATISYNAMSNGEVRVAIADVTGKIVATVFNGVQAKGEHNFEFDLRNFAEGIYVITVKTNNSVKTMKLSVIK